MSIGIIESGFTTGTEATHELQRADEGVAYTLGGAGGNLEGWTKTRA